MSVKWAALEAAGAESLIRFEIEAIQHQLRRIRHGGDISFPRSPGLTLACLAASKPRFELRSRG